MKHTFKYKFKNRKIIIESGELAKNANGSILIKYDNNILLTTVVMEEKCDKNIDFFPLHVSFEEKFYSIGKIPGNFLRRENRPSEFSILISRLIDRSIRPFFDEKINNEIQIINTALSINNNYLINTASVFSSSLALCISDIPFYEPVSCVTIGLINKKFIIDPTIEEMKNSIINLVISGTKDNICMIECSSEIVSEKILLKAIKFGHKYIKKLCFLQFEIIKKIGKKKIKLKIEKFSKKIKNNVLKIINKNFNKLFFLNKNKNNNINNIKILEKKILDFFDNLNYKNDDEKKKILNLVKKIFLKIFFNKIKKIVLKKKIRLDNRKFNELRKINSKVDLFKNVHGCSLFSRGETQVLSVCTLGSNEDAQYIDDLSENKLKNFMFHYNFPPYCVGEIRNFFYPSRREIGHGALCEKALLKVLPSIEKFPYTIRLVAEVLESNGSSSQASICAGSLALMAAGVPIKDPVAGIAMGLISSKNFKNYAVLSDIQGIEDFFGDIDFKIAGTKNGITAIQMDIKNKGIKIEILKKIFKQSYFGRIKIINNMNKIINKPRKNINKNAPKIIKFLINPKKIKNLIGVRGKNINKIINDFNNVKIDIKENGEITIFHKNINYIKKAKLFIKNIIKDVKIGEIYNAKVIRIEKFGVFVELFKGKNAFLHISKIANKYINKIEEVMKINDFVKVKVIEIDNKKRINVSSKILL